MSNEQVQKTIDTPTLDEIARATLPELATFEREIHTFWRGGKGAAQPTTPPLGKDVLGLPYLYSHDNMPQGHPLYAASCGQAAIATMFDYWNINRYGLTRNVTKLKNGYPIPDGRPHFPSALTEKVLNEYPPTNWLGVRFTTREIIRGALAANGFKVDESHAGALGNGSEERAALIQWFKQHPRLPLICLVSMKDIDPVGYKDEGWYECLHWGVVHAVNATHVWMASWHEDFAFTWERFMAGWHCSKLPWPNNYYAIHAWR